MEFLKGILICAAIISLLWVCNMFIIKVCGGIEQAIPMLFAVVQFFILVNTFDTPE